VKGKEFGVVGAGAGILTAFDAPSTAVSKRSIKGSKPGPNAF